MKSLKLLALILFAAVLVIPSALTRPVESQTFSEAPVGFDNQSNGLTDQATFASDLATFTDFEQLRGLRFAGRATGRSLLEWPSGHFSEARGDGHVVVAPPSGVVTMTPSARIE